jgi:hypothetical protein
LSKKLVDVEHRYWERSEAISCLRSGLLHFLQAIGQQDPTGLLLLSLRAQRSNLDAAEADDVIAAAPIFCSMWEDP